MGKDGLIVIAFRPHDGRADLAEADTVSPSGTF